MRVGVIPYVNGLPLTASLACERVLAPPSRLLPLLLEDHIDAALMPAFDRFLVPGLTHVPGLMIGCDGPSETVLLHLDKPIADVRRVRLDPASRSSNALLRILLARKHNLTVEYVDGDADAWLTIGDASFKPGGRPTLDLGAEWKDWTGLPFVFAVWTYKKSHPHAKEIVDVLTRARVRDAAPPPVDGVEPARIARYLSETMRYDLGERETAGLDRYIALCREMKLL